MMRGRNFHALIFITGDKHGDMEFVRRFCDEHPGICRDDVLIILGDVIPVIRNIWDTGCYRWMGVT